MRMLTRHVTPLIVRHVHGQLSPRQRARVINHVRTCDRCRAALAREERVAGELRREMPRLGQPASAQLSRVWAGVWQEISGPHQARRPSQGAWLPGLSMVVAVVLAVAVVLPALRDGGVRVEAAPVQALPLATSSPTPGAAETGVAWVASAEPERPAPAATRAVAGATPAPMPAATVSPEAPGGGRWR